MIGTIISLLPTIASMFASDSANDKYQSSLSEMQRNNRLSPYALQAKNLLAENATRGLAGYDTYRNEIEQSVPVTLNQWRDALTSGQAVDWLARSRAEADRQLRSLNAQDAQARDRNTMAYAQGLTGLAQMDDANNLENMALGMNMANANVSNAAQKNAALGSLSNTFSGLADEDWSKLVALFSRDPYSLDLTTGKDYGIPSGPSNSIYVDRMTPLRANLTY